MSVHGRVIVLNGASSAGKTSLATALQDLLPDPYFHLDSDIFRLFLPLRFLTRDDDDGSAERGMRFVSGFHASAAAFAAAGNNVIVDNMLSNPAWLWDSVQAFVRFEPLFVGLRCPLEVVEARERARGDRQIGLARLSTAVTHVHARYDLDLDSSAAPSGELAATVANYLAGGGKPTAYRRMATEAPATSSRR